jgi:hypothetical protein
MAADTDRRRYSANAAAFRQMASQMFDQFVTRQF